MTEVTRNDETRRRGGAQETDMGRSIGEGIGFALIAGAIFTAVWIIAAAATGQSPLSPIRTIASVFFGASAFDFGAGTAILAAALVGVVLSAIFGAIYGLINARLPLEAHTNVGTQAVIGLVFGAALWLVMVQIIARFAFPSYLEETNQLGQFLLHTLFFGLPLGLFYGSAERRAVMKPGRPTRREAAQPA
jgi:small-conductance mechanosensitive channel